MRGLYTLAESLSHFPERGSQHRTSSGFEVRVVLYGHFRVVYRIEGQGVVVLGIFHGAMDLQRYLP